LGGDRLYYLYEGLVTRLVYYSLRATLPSSLQFPQAYNNPWVRELGEGVGKGGFTEEFRVSVGCTLAFDNSFTIINSSSI